MEGLNPTDVVAKAKFFSIEMPDYFLQTEWLIPNWKWITLLLLVVIGYILKSTFKRYFRFIKNQNGFNSRLTPYMSKIIQTPIEKPLAWIIVSIFWLVFIRSLELTSGLENTFITILKVLLTFNIIHTLNLTIEAWGNFYQNQLTQLNDNRLNNQLIPFATKTAKVLVFIFGALILLQSLGVDVMALIAGLGVGSLAVALAAQETFANLLGSVNILMDKPFKVGDFIKIGDTEGTIEEIGFRSTRIRTPYNSLVSIPNATMAKEKIDNMTERPSRRIRHVLGLTYNTTPDQILAFNNEIKKAILEDNATKKDTVIVAFTGYGDFALQITISFHSFLSTLEEEFEMQQRILFKIYKIAQEQKVEFAFPTQTILLNKS